MFVCDRCGKGLIDVVDIFLLALTAVNLIFGILMVLMGTWFGLGSLFLAFLFGAAFTIRRRECKHCRAGRKSSETQR